MTRALGVASLCSWLWLGAVLVAAPAEGLRPVPTFSPGEAVRYRMNLMIALESSLGPEDDPTASEQGWRRAVDLTWRIEFVAQEEDGSTQLRAVIEALEVEPPEWGERFRAADFVGQAVSYRLSPDGRVEDVQVPAAWHEQGTSLQWLGAWLDLSPGSQPGWPARPLKPGDRWKSTRAREVPGLPRQRETAEAEYLRDEVRGEIPCAAFLTRFTTSGSDTREETSPDQSRTRTDRRLEGEGDRLACYDLRNGRVVESTQRSRELLRLRIQEIPRERRASPPLVLETRTRLESHLRVLD